MKYLTGIFVFFAGLMIHWLLSSYFAVWGLVPHVLLVLTICVSVKSGSVVGQCYGFAWGLFLDVASAHVFGANALAFTLTGYMIGTLRKQMDVESLAPCLLFVLIWTPMYFVFYATAGWVFERVFLWAEWKKFFIEPFYNCLVAPFCLAFVRKFINF